MRFSRRGSGSFLESGNSRRECPASFQTERQLPEIHSHSGPENESRATIKVKQAMNRKYLLLALASVLAVGGVWLSRSTYRSAAIHQSTSDVGIETSPGAPKSGQILRPPDPVRRFTDFTPEQRVEFARRGHGPGG